MKKQLLITCLLLAVSSGINAQENNEVKKEEHEDSGQTSIDIMSGHKGLVSEFFFLKPVDLSSRWLAISRSELHLPDYHSEHPEFVNFNTFSYNFKNGIGIGAGTYAGTHYQFSARLGLQYFKENEQMLFYTFLSTSVLDNPDAQLLVIGSYMPAIGHNLRLIARAEWRTAMSYDHGHAFSNQVLRLGVQYKRVIGGIGGELEELGTHFEEFDFNTGPFVRLMFR